MITREKAEYLREKCIAIFENAGIVITEQEKMKIEIADFGLNRLEDTGLELLVYVNTNRVCAKELVMFPGQTCPEHRHPNIGDVIGKEETFRCRWGKVYLYVPGEKTSNPKCRAPLGCEACYTAWHEIELSAGEQYTLMPDTLHWFQAGENGAVVSEFSTTSRDELDIFTDPNIIRIPEIAN